MITFLFSTMKVKFIENLYLCNISCPSDLRGKIEGKIFEYDACTYHEPIEDGLLCLRAISIILIQLSRGILE